MADRELQAMAHAMSEAWRAYLYPGTDTLANKLDLRDPAALGRAERTLTAGRLADLPRTPHTPEGYQAIHAHLFQDVYEWAGRPRTVDMHRTEVQPDGTLRRDVYLPARHIARGLETAFADLLPALPRLRAEAAKPPAGRDAKLVAEVVAAHVGALNFAHAFREGNGRAMRAQADNLAREAGLRLNEAALDRREWGRGAHEVNGDPSATATLARALAAALEPRERSAERERSAAAGVRPPHVPRHARDAPGRRDERDYGLGD